MQQTEVDQTPKSFNYEQKTIFFTSLGCSKNLVDSQVMLGHLGLDGFQIVSNPEEAEVIIINTCSFIEASKVESVDTILEMADYKDEGSCKALVVSGCLAQRYSMDLEKELPEVDLFIGTGEYFKIVPLLKALADGKLEKKSFVEIPKYIHTEFDPRLNTSPGYMAWLKVSEGCNRNCTFCIIPTLRGKLRSRTVKSLVEEAKKLVDSGVKELNLISQDLSDYGVDLPEEDNLPNLLRGLESVKGLEWVRLYYHYPEDLTDELIEVMAASKKVCPYLDMPIQHFSEKILRKMNRRCSGDEIRRKVQRLREALPNIVLRTSVIVGFPTETEEDFQELCQGIEELRFDHLGVFKYSDEEGTPAFHIKPKVDAELIDDRFNEVYSIQREVLEEINQKYLGQIVEVLVEGIHPETELLLQGRHIGQAPDIDGKVIINDGMAKAGDLVKVQITELAGYDLVGGIVTPN